ncbi:MAG: CTP-dependent riboflavin kinase [Thaumarchaeota archaeon]|nr:MAG: CTP-dependent riboflavin kinase [Nitrososphaerota archaeon]
MKARLKIVDKVIVPFSARPFLSRQGRPPDVKKGSYTFHGKVFSGSGRGAYYVGHPEYVKRFKELLGYEPFPGTLNVKLDSEEDIRERRRLRLRGEGLRIEEFHIAGERFSSVNCFKGRLENETIALLIVAITDYDDSVLELISPVYLREKLRLKDGSAVAPTIEYYLSR